MEADSGFLTILMNFVAPVLLGAVIAYAMWRTWGRRQNSAAQARTGRATEALYASEERDRRRGNTE
jgi:hypothetical protein